MAGNSPEARTNEQQADDIVAKLQNQESVTQPISPEVKALAEKKIDTLQEVDGLTIRAALDKLKVDAGNKPADGVKEIKEALVEINPENLQKAATISEKVINMIPSSETRNTLRGVHGAIIFGLLRDAGHNLTMQNGQITIVPKPGIDVLNLQEKLQTLIHTGSLSLETIQLGMLYSSPAFKEYASLKKVTAADGKELIDPRASTQDFLQYVQDLEKSGKKEADIHSILQSRNILMGVDMQKAIKGFQDMGHVSAWIEKNPKIMNAVGVGQALTSAPFPKAPDEPNTTLTGKIAKDGITGGHVTGVVGDSTKGLVQGLGDILSLGKGDPIATLAIGGALVYGIFKAFQKFGFLGGLGTLFGLGAMNNVDKILSRFGVGSVSEAVDKAGKKAGEIADEVGKKIDGKKEGKDEEKPKENIEKQKLTPSQESAQKEVMKESSKFNAMIQSHAKANPNQSASLDEYVNFLHSSEFQSQKLDNILYSQNPKASIFQNEKNWELSIRIPGTMNPIILKKILRQYLTGSFWLDSDVGDKEKSAFEKKYSLSEKDKNKSIKDILPNIYK